MTMIDNDNDNNRDDGDNDDDYDDDDNEWMQIEQWFPTDYVNLGSIKMTKMPLTNTS